MLQVQSVGIAMYIAMTGITGATLVATVVAVIYASWDAVFNGIGKRLALGGDREMHICVNRSTNHISYLYWLILIMWNCSILIQNELSIRCFIIFFYANRWISLINKLVLVSVGFYLSLYNKALDKDDVKARSLQTVLGPLLATSLRMISVSNSLKGRGISRYFYHRQNYL